MTDIEAGEYHAVGPIADVYGHGPVTIIQEEEVKDHATEAGDTLFVCLDCGYTDEDYRLFAHQKCDRLYNNITTTWREYIRDEKFDGPLPTPDPDEEWPHENQ